MLSYFISYSHKDIIVAQTINDSLMKNGDICWRDEKWLTAGDDFAEEITIAIRNCDVFLLLLSESSNRSDFVSKEVAIAYYFGKVIAPIRIEAVEPSDRLLPYLVRQHYLVLSDNGIPWLIDQLSILQHKFVQKNIYGSNDLLWNGMSKAKVKVENQQIISSSEYRDFLENIGHSGQILHTPSGRRLIDCRSDAPITNISWDDALEYCDWKGGSLPILCDNDYLSERNKSQKNTSTGVLNVWSDSGTVLFKHVRRQDDNRLIAMLNRTSSLHNVGFSCCTVPISTENRMIAINGGACELGCDVSNFTSLADIHKLPPYLRTPILGRHRSSHYLNSYAISEFCVTNEQFFLFTQATGRPWPIYWHSKWFSKSDRPFPRRMTMKPVVNVSAEEAEEYASWAHARLPRWAEWERAAASPAMNAYPWGKVYDANRCNSFESGRGSLATVDEFQKGTTTEGVRQLCGNVFEWVVGPDGKFEIRGGSYQVPCAIWGLVYAFQETEPGHTANDIGFRIVVY